MTSAFSAFDTVKYSLSHTNPMRELQSFSDERRASRLVSVLLSRSIQATVGEEDDSWVVWVLKDDDRDSARLILNEFLVNPDAPEFAAAEKAAKEQLAAAQKSSKARQRSTHASKIPLLTEVAPARRERRHNPRANRARR